MRFDWTPTGFHAMVLSAGDIIFIDPYSRNDTAHYISYFKRDYLSPAGKVFPEAPLAGADVLSAQEIAALRASPGQKASGAQLRTYRLAVAEDENLIIEGQTVPVTPDNPAGVVIMPTVDDPALEDDPDAGTLVLKLYLPLITHRSYALVQKFDFCQKSNFSGRQTSTA